MFAEFSFSTARKGSWRQYLQQNLLKLSRNAHNMIRAIFKFSKDLFSAQSVAKGASPIRWQKMNFLQFTWDAYEICTTAETSQNGDFWSIFWYFIIHHKLIVFQSHRFCVNVEHSPKTTPHNISSIKGILWCVFNMQKFPSLETF